MTPNPVRATSPTRRSHPWPPWWAAICLLGALVLSAGCPSAPSGPVASSRHFAFWSDPAIGLHHFLYQWARAEADVRAGRATRVVVSERDSFGDRALAEEERARWTAAIEHYVTHMVERSLLFDEDLVTLRDQLVGLGPDTPQAEPETRQLLDDIMSIYQRHWWPDHDAGNRAWIAALVPALEPFEDTLPRQMAEAYGGTWPVETIRVDVSPYADRWGAYTHGTPHVTLSSTDPGYAMPWAVEMLFHETSHADTLETPITKALGDAFMAYNVRTPGQLWHHTIFHTTGALARMVWAEQGEPDYTPYGHLHIFPGHPARVLDALEAQWRPYLEGRHDRDQALGGLADTLGPIESAKVYAIHIGRQAVDKMAARMTDDHVLGLNGAEIAGRDRALDAWRAFWAMAPDASLGRRLDARIDDDGRIVVGFDVVGSHVVRAGAVVQGDWTLPVEAVATMRDAEVAGWHETYDASILDAVGR